MLEVSPESRVTAAEALMHPWLDVLEDDYCVAGTPPRRVVRALIGKCATGSISKFAQLYELGNEKCVCGWHALY